MDIKINQVQHLGNDIALSLALNDALNQAVRLPKAERIEIINAVSQALLKIASESENVAEAGNAQISPCDDSRGDCNPHTPKR